LNYAVFEVINLQVTKEVAITLFLVLSLMLMSPSFTFRTMAEGASGSGLFSSVWDNGLPGYYIVSDHVFSLNVYVLSLPDVGNFRASNHSAVVEGVKQAVAIRDWNGQTEELRLLLNSSGFYMVMKLEVNVSYTMVEDWNTYRTLVETGNDTMIVNTHDEYLPVPEGYTKEEWTDKIADFMLTRWGTWVHVGGYPFYRVQYQNGTTETWGENGFKQLMKNIGKTDVNCESPPVPENERVDIDQGAVKTLGLDWYWWDGLKDCNIADFALAGWGAPLKYSEFNESLIMTLYSWPIGSEMYMLGAVIRYSPNASAFNFGIYVHLGSWQFYDADGRTIRDVNGNSVDDFAMGFLSTATAVYGEFSCAATELYGGNGNSASEAIQKAEEQGRTVGLAKAEGSFQNALDAFASGNYKVSAAYALQAKLTAEGAATQNTLPQAAAAVIAMITMPIAVVVYYRKNNKNNNKK
jgi:hypothetical protein